MSNNDEIRALAELLKFNRTTKKRSCEFREDKIQQLRVEEVERSGLYLMWDPIEERWVYVGEAEDLRYRWREHLNWGSYLFSNIGHALAHSLRLENLIPVMNSRKQIKERGLEREFDQLNSAIQNHVKDWCVTWIPTPSREIGLRKFLEANAIAALSGAHAAKDSWLGRSLEGCTCKGKKVNAEKVVRSRLWNTELVNGLQTSGWVECLEKRIR